MSEIILQIFYTRRICSYLLTNRVEVSLLDIQNTKYKCIVKYYARLIYERRNFYFVLINRILNIHLRSKIRNEDNFLTISQSFFQTRFTFHKYSETYE